MGKSYNALDWRLVEEHLPPAAKRTENSFHLFCMGKNELLGRLDVLCSERTENVAKKFYDLGMTKNLVRAIFYPFWVQLKEGKRDIQLAAVIASGAKRLEVFLTSNGHEEFNRQFLENETVKKYIAKCKASSTRKETQMGRCKAFMMWVMTTAIRGGVLRKAHEGARGFAGLMLDAHDQCLLARVKCLTVLGKVVCGYKRYVAKKTADGELYLPLHKTITPYEGSLLKAPKQDEPFTCTTNQAGLSVCKNIIMTYQWAGDEYQEARTAFVQKWVKIIEDLNAQREAEAHQDFVDQGFSVEQIALIEEIKRNKFVATQFFGLSGAELSNELGYCFDIVAKGKPVTGPNHNDARNRQVIYSSRLLFSWQNTKLLRCLLTCPAETLTGKGLRTLALYVYNIAKVERIVNVGKRIKYGLDILNGVKAVPEIKDTFERIWLERIIRDWRSEEHFHGKDWEIPVEVDQSQECCATWGVILHNMPLMQQTNVLWSGKINDIYTYNEMVRWFAKPTITPLVYGSIAEFDKMLQHAIDSKFITQKEVDSIGFEELDKMWQHIMRTVNSYTSPLGIIGMIGPMLSNPEIKEEYVFDHGSMGKLVLCNQHAAKVDEQNEENPFLQFKKVTDPATGKVNLEPEYHPDPNGIYEPRDGYRYILTQSGYVLKQDQEVPTLIGKKMEIRYTQFGTPYSAMVSYNPTAEIHFDGARVSQTVELELFRHHVWFLNNHDAYIVHPNHGYIVRETTQRAYWELYQNAPHNFGSFLLGLDLKDKSGCPKYVGTPEEAYMQFRANTLRNRYGFDEDGKYTEYFDDTLTYRDFKRGFNALA